MMKTSVGNQAEIQLLENEVSRNEREIAQFESELMSPDSNSEGIEERKSELLAKNVRLRSKLARLKNPGTPHGRA
jgi:hypothetical protein